MQVVQVDFDAVGDLHAHEGEALGRQAVGFVDEALPPFDLLEAAPVVVGDGVEAAAEGDAAGGGRAVGVGVCFVDVGVVVEVLIYQPLEAGRF